MKVNDKKWNDYPSKCFNYYCAMRPTNAVLKNPMIAKICKPGEESFELVETIYLCDRCYEAKRRLDIATGKIIYYDPKNIYR